MNRKIVLAAMVLTLCATFRYATAMGSVVEVTRETQATLGLKYTLEADRVDDQAVLVKMEIQRSGKLKNVRSVSISIGAGRPEVAATLQTTPGKTGSWVVGFQVSPTMADKCSVDLTVPEAGRTYVVYAVALKGYVTNKK